jgi:hypothetical protein
MATFSADDVNPEIAARSFEIMQQNQVTMQEAKRMGTGIMTVIALVKGQIENIKQQTIENAKPADINRQRELLNKPPLEPEKPVITKKVSLQVRPSRVSIANRNQ